MGCPRNSIIYHKLPYVDLDGGLVGLTDDIDLLDMFVTHEGFNVPIEVYIDSPGMYNGSEDDEEEFNVPRESDPDTEHEGDEGDNESGTSGLVMSSEENEEYDVPIEEEVHEVQKRVCTGSNWMDDLSDGDSSDIEQLTFPSETQEHGDGIEYTQFDEVKDMANPEVVKGMMFKSVYEFRNFLKEYHVKIGSDFTYVKNDKDRVTVICKEKCGF
ncbi:uncharacterized protein LOC131326282 isoform X2 [Rhododendron vialii]|uniref:uncharacterized protein LOC131326282 isoform X2 n=1 Tax=Rhododendron vialii TaxID=182163 RepID=UPI00265E0A93|nr:uncharacterized protein LOC131326282 isoform X2 [Rhododendron vialii]